MLSTRDMGINEAPIHLQPFTPRPSRYPSFRNPSPARPTVAGHTPSEPHQA